MATGARCAPENRQTEGRSHAADYLVSEPVRVSHRITVHAQDGVIGFFRRDSQRLIDIECCPIACEEINRSLAGLRAQSQIRDGHYTLRAGSEPRVFSQTNDAVASALRD